MLLLADVFILSLNYLKSELKLYLGLFKQIKNNPCILSKYPFSKNFDFVLVKFKF